MLFTSTVFSLLADGLGKVLSCVNTSSRSQWHHSWILILLSAFYPPASASGSFLSHASMSSLPTGLQVRLHASVKAFPNEETKQSTWKRYNRIYFSRSEWNKSQLTGWLLGLLHNPKLWYQVTFFYSERVCTHLGQNGNYLLETF